MTATAAAGTVLLTAPSAYAAEENASLGFEATNSENGSEIRSDGAVNTERAHGTGEAATLHMPLSCDAARMVDDTPFTAMFPVETDCAEDSADTETTDDRPDNDSDEGSDNAPSDSTMAEETAGSQHASLQFQP